MPTLGTRGDVVLGARRQGANRLATTLRGASPRFQPIGSFTGSALEIERQAKHAIDLVFGRSLVEVVTKPGFRTGKSGFTGTKETTIIGRGFPSNLERIEQERAVFDELARQGLLPAQQGLGGKGSFSALQDARTELAALRSDRGIDAPASNVLQSGDRFPRFPNPFGGFPSDTEDLPRGRGQETVPTPQFLAEFFRANLQNFSPQQRKNAAAGFLEAGFVHAQLAGLPIGTTPDEAVQIRELQTNRLRRFGPSTAPNFLASQFSQFGSQNERFVRTKLGGPTAQADRELEEFLGLFSLKNRKPSSVAGLAIQQAKLTSQAAVTAAGRLNAGATFFSSGGKGFFNTPLTIPELRADPERPTAPRVDTAFRPGRAPRVAFNREAQRNQIAASRRRANILGREIFFADELVAAGIPDTPENRLAFSIIEDTFENRKKLGRLKGKGAIG